MQLRIRFHEKTTEMALAHRRPYCRSPELEEAAGLSDMANLEQTGLVMINSFPPDEQTAVAVEEPSDGFRSGACPAKNGGENAVSGHTGISKVTAVAALLFALAACTSTVQPSPHQQPASADPVPASSRTAASPSPGVNVTIADLLLDGRPVTSGQKVTITGPVAARHVSGRFTAAAPAGDRFFALTTPFNSASTAGQASYVQGEIIPGAGGSWSATVSIGSNASYPANPDRVTIVLATPSVAATLAGYEGQPGTLRPVPALTWQTLATITITRQPASALS